MYKCLIHFTKMYKICCKCSHILIFLLAANSFVHSQDTDFISGNMYENKESVVKNYNDLNTVAGNMYGYQMATTPKIDPSKAPSRYEQGLEDYEEAVARVEKTKEDQQTNGVGQLARMFSLIMDLSSAWNKVSRGARNANSGITNSVSSSYNALRNISNDVHESVLVRKNREENSTAVEEGRYIKGDPLKGYYDFVITEGSYKFWAAFQLFTALLMIYSTFAAIYYSKVNPIVSDYDYVSYLGGRSMADDPEPAAPGTYQLSSLLNSHWMETAAHGFEFILDAIDRIPQS